MAVIKSDMDVVMVEVDVVVCSAVEESLVGTAGQTLINDLYHGKMTNVIQCRLCGQVSKHSEDFLDLCVSVTGSARLEDSLARMFLEPEVLDTSNRYRCDACGQLTDAVKSSKLCHIPPILTVSLLRFNYDPVKMERYKETGHFEFPPLLDMSRFCESSKPVIEGDSKPAECVCSAINGPDCSDKLGLGDSPSSTQTAFCPTYELFSVVLHRGGAHGGHYHALIRDIQGRGLWSEPQQTVTSTTDMTPPVPCAKPAPLSTITEVDLTSPRAVISFILQQSGGMSLGELSVKIASLAGGCWRKRYKTRHGSFVKFLTDNNDVFVYDTNRGWISLVPDIGQLHSEGNKSEVNRVATLSPILDHDPTPAVSKNSKKKLELKCDELDVSSPRSVITSILLGAGGTAGLSVTELCSKITEVTGDSWRKCYKPEHGSLVKFLNNNSESFVFDVSGGWVSLLAKPSGTETTEQSDANKNNSGSISATFAVQRSDISSAVSEDTKPRSKRNRKKSKSKPAAQELTHTLHEEPKESKETVSMLPEGRIPKPGHCWFDFNDSTIRPVPTEDIEKHFAGKECAYMLFYRALPTTDTSSTLKHLEIPDWLISEIAGENLELERQRADYEEFVNMVEVDVHFGRAYECCEGVLRPRIGTCYHMDHTVDLRQDASQLLHSLTDLGGELVDQCRTVHIAKSVPSGGIHLYQEVTSSLTASLKSCGVVQSTMLFVWNGQEVGGVAIAVGVENEPITLGFELEASPGIFRVTVAKSTTVLALKAVISHRLQLSCLDKVDLYQVKNKGSRRAPLDIDKTVSELRLSGKDKIVIRHSGSPIALKTAQLCAGGSSVKESENALPGQITVNCENHVGDNVVTVEVVTESAASVEELKVLIMTSADVPIELVADVRLRVRLDDLGIRGVGPPLHETIDLATARLFDGVNMVLECGKAPCGSEIVLTVSVNASTELELTVDHEMPIHQLLHEVLLRSGISDETEEWHLCVSDWTGDTGAVLNEPTQTVGDAGLNHGDHLFLRPGRPPPPGFLKIFVHLESSPARPCWWDPVREMAAAVSPSPVGSVVISKQSTLVELKWQVMSALLQDFDVASPQFLRLRLLTSFLQPSTILRHNSQPLSKMRLGNSCVLGVEVLPVEEDIGPDQIMLTVRRRLPGERSYGDWAQEVIWDTSQGATAASLHHIVTDTIGEMESSIRMAKHIPDKFAWLIIPHSDDAFHGEKCVGGGVGGAKKKRKRKGRNVKSSGSVCDLKSAPFSLQDGDVIGVKVADEPGGEDSDFSSVDDDIGREKARSQQKDSLAVNEALKMSNTQTSSATSRVETTIKIHVDNFR